ncbi:protein-L-isoaspartate O-methyltransferase [Sediminicoccus sp. KRV36]|uniref:protein-L-isoaspartate O-methyltransferase family protein n=1 Tax=Sediminicoccus sp. KRV36 TaxID=3133721 RepID=UPI00200ED81F|nr:protein-L-isoaspartate O-methyltransferase [Sediminicoccus rosea]UPY39217.1 protein-L-isoaspartate O-methyltransferase [Sediminicoccus rosea]
MLALDVDFARARRFMRDGQLAPNGVTDPLLLAAMDDLPREVFLPAAMRHRAYADEAVPLGGGRALLAPMVLARLLQMALPQPGERALVLASGTGYGAAVLARMGLKVLGIEAEPGLVAAARHALDFALEANRPDIEQGEPGLGAPAGAPFRLILIEGAVETIPAALFSQLGEGGRLVTIRREAGRVGRAVLYRRAGGAVSTLQGLDAAGPLLPGFITPPDFIL